jgi:phage/plasmid-like protein (TIGR03299 family)
MKSTEQILNENGLNWNVTKERLMYAGECTPSANNGLHHTDYYGIVREDTGEVFTTVKEGYTPTQNSTIIDTMQSIAGNNDLIITKAVPINGGRKILVQMQKPDNTVDIGGQETKQYVYAINSHDGTSALKFGFMNQVVFCQNQFAWMSNNGLKGYVHKQSIQDKVDNLPEILNFDGQEERIAQLQEMSMNPTYHSEILRFIDYMTGIDSTLEGWPDNCSTRKLNIRDDLQLCVESELNRVGRNKWGLFNGVTKYTSHSKSIPNRENGREESVYTGSGQKMNDNAFKWLVNEGN